MLHNLDLIRVGYETGMKSYSVEAFREGDNNQPIAGSFARSENFLTIACRLLDYHSKCLEAMIKAKNSVIKESSPTGQYLPEMRGWDLKIEKFDMLNLHHTERDVLEGIVHMHNWIATSTEAQESYNKRK